MVEVKILMPQTDESRGGCPRRTRMTSCVSLLACLHTASGWTLQRAIVPPQSHALPRRTAGRSEDHWASCRSEPHPRRTLWLFQPLRFQGPGRASSALPPAAAPIRHLRSPGWKMHIGLALTLKLSPQELQLLSWLSPDK